MVLVKDDINQTPMPLIWQLLTYDFSNDDWNEIFSDDDAATQILRKMRKLAMYLRKNKTIVQTDLLRFLEALSECCHEINTLTAVRCKNCNCLICGWVSKVKNDKN